MKYANEYLQCITESVQPPFDAALVSELRRHRAMIDKSLAGMSQSFYSAHPVADITPVSRVISHLLTAAEYQTKNPDVYDFNMAEAKKYWTSGKLSPALLAKMGAELTASIARVLGLDSK